MANETQKERLKILGEIGNLTQKINAFNKQGIEDEKRANDLNKERLKLAEKLRGINQKIRDEQRSSYVDAQNSIKGMASLYEPLKSAEKQRIQMQLNGNDLSKVALDRSNRLAGINQQIANLTGDQTLEKQILQDEYTSEIAKLEKNKGITSDIIDNLNAQNEMAKDYASLTDRQKQSLQRHRDVLDGIHDTVSGTLDTFRLLTSTVGGVFGSALIGAGVVIDKLGHSAHELGTFFTESTVSATALGLVFKDSVGVVKGLSAEMGGIENATFEAQAKTNLLANNLNMSGESTARMVGAFARLNDNSTETALNVAASTKQFAIQQGVIPGQVMEDVANSAEAFALYGKEGGKNIGQAAVMAAKLGVNMATITGVTDSLLDFESSITKELELGAMLGRNINLNKARQLAYDGKLGASVKETIKQMGGLDAFNKMDVFQKRQAAEAAGMTVEQFQKMAANLDNINDKGEIQLGTFDTMKETMKTIATGPLGSVVKGMGSAAIAAGQMGFKLKDGLASMKGMGGIGGKIKGFFKGMAGGGAGVGGGLSESTVPPKTGDGGGASKFMKSVGKIKMGEVLKGAAAMLVVAGAVFVFGKAVQEFMKVSWSAVGMAVVSMLALVGSVALLGAIMTSGVGAVAILAGAAAMLVIAGSLFVLGHALQAIGTGFEMMGSGITSLLPTITGMVSAIGPLALMVPTLAGLAGAFALLGYSLLTLGVLGLPGLAVLAGIAAVATPLMKLASVFGLGGDEGAETTAVEDGSLSEYQSQMLQKMDMLIQTTAANKDVYLDKDKVTNLVMERSERMTGNVFGLGVA